jgi:2-keto-4-pentenoate hydratase/2-oxohepta-3-ene-1,7-dioic acid hydratase in catechol pathway
MKSVTLHGSIEPIPVQKIICLGQNYAEHAKELKFDVPVSPVIFLKPASAIIHQGEQIIIPSISKDVHHEIELTVLIGKSGKNIPRESALQYVAGYGVGLDMTMRDVQFEAKKKGLPWSLAKGFDTAAPVSEFLTPDLTGDPMSLGLQLKINGKIRQASKTSKLIFSIDTIISYISQFMTFERGDIIYTGTPEGVSRVDHGDKLEAVLQHADGHVLTSLSVSVL